MIIVCLIVIISIPYIIGNTLWKMIMNSKEEKNLGEDYLLGLFWCLLMGEGVHVIAIFRQWRVEHYIVCYTGLINILLVLVIFYQLYLLYQKKKQNRLMNIKKRISFYHMNNPGFTKKYLEVLGYSLFIGGLIIFIMYSQPDERFDLLLEQVNTMLYTGEFWEINPVTGRSYEVGVPMRIKILGFPSILAMIVDSFGLSPMEVIRIVIPISTLLTAYLVIYQWALYFLKGKRKYIFWFLTGSTILIIFGSYASFMPSYGLLYRGYHPEVIAQWILYPMIILEALQKNYKYVGLACMVEIGLVWTFYGLGMGMFFSVVIYFIYQIPLVKGKK